MSRWDVECISFEKYQLKKQSHRDYKTCYLSSFVSSLAVLQVNIVSCRDLPELAIAADGQCLLDPYVKLQLLPEKQHRVKTRLVRATRNPLYEETFSMYGIEPEQLNATSLHFAVCLRNSTIIFWLSLISVPLTQRFERMGVHANKADNTLFACFRCLWVEPARQRDKHTHAYLYNVNIICFY